MITATDSFQWRNSIRKAFFLIYARENIIVIIERQKEQREICII